LIDIERTIKEFGYDPNKLSYGSNRKIWAICEDCRKERLVEFKSYSIFCKSCFQLGKRNNMYGKTGNRNPMFGKDVSEETKQKISNNHADVSGKNNPMYGVKRFGKDNPHWKGGQRETNRRHSNKRRKLLDSNPIYLNKDFYNSHGHHINTKYIIHIPAELHRSIWHKQSDEFRMHKINKLAFKYLLDNKENMIVSDETAFYINLMVL